MVDEGGYYCVSINKGFPQLPNRGNKIIGRSCHIYFAKKGYWNTSSYNLYNLKNI